MLSSDDLTQTTDDLVTGELETGALERIPRMLDRKSFVSERRQSILQQKQTDTLPHLTTDTPNAKVAWRQVAQLREENRRLRFELEEVQVELQRLVADYQALQSEFESEVSIIHNGHQQEIEHHQSHLREVTKERNRLQEALQQLEQRYQDLYHSFQDAAEEEAHKMVTEAAQTLTLSPEKRPVLLQGMMETVELQVRRTEDKHLVEALYLKREVQSMLEQIQQKYHEFDQELKNLLAMQHTAREQAKMRQKVLHSRLQARWTIKAVFTTLSVLFLLIALQFLCLNLFHVQVVSNLSLALITPIVVCVVLAIVLATPISMIKHIYTGAPHKKRVKEDL
jgi:DNA repair exonuclease SbcCD ATPase subunit